ncbi:DUF302 domain-containing protein [Ectothiorhodospiraceae bacterium BW-2]|nr:DUF302 domain-containing protein [Ectothiorhodospiraceae bacterium BW-2]
MAILRNLLALIGLVALLLGGYLYSQYNQLLGEFDPDAAKVYAELVDKLRHSKDAATATIWKVPVAEGLSAEDVEETMRMVANEKNMSNVGELPIYKDIEAKTGETYRFAKIYMFCNSLIAKKMIDYNDDYSAYLPCRITLLEDQQGKLWLIALNMDLMIYGGAPLPPELKREAEQVKTLILEIMERGAKGEW